MTSTRATSDSGTEPQLPADDPSLFDLDLRGLRTRWAATANQPPELETPSYGRVPPGKEIAFGLHAVDQDGDTLAIEHTEKPASAS